MKSFVSENIYMYTYTVFILLHTLLYEFLVWIIIRKNNVAGNMWIDTYDNKRILLKHLNTLCISFILLYCFGLHIHIQALFSTNVNCLWIYTFCLSIIDKQNNWLHANNTCKHANRYGCYFINEFYQIMNWYNIR